jgi:hypothetical protein
MQRAPISSSATALVNRHVFSCCALTGWITSASRKNSGSTEGKRTQPLDSAEFQKGSCWPQERGTTWRIWAAPSGPKEQPSLVPCPPDASDGIQSRPIASDCIRSGATNNSTKTFAAPTSVPGKADEVTQGQNGWRSSQCKKLVDQWWGETDGGLKLKTKLFQSSRNEWI